VVRDLTYTGWGYHNRFNLKMRTKIKPTNNKQQDEVLVRLKRARGQIEGVIKMYEEGRGCLEVVTQISAAREALAAAGKRILSGEAVACSWRGERDKLDRILKELFKIQ